MKKISMLLTVFIASALLAGCQSSKIKVETESPQGGVILENPGKGTEETTKYETQAYTIPEGATGPGDVKITEDADSYPEDKKPADHTGEIQIRYFYINSKGLNEEYDIIVAEECTAGDLNELLIRTGVLVDGTEVVSFESDGKDGVLTLNQLEGVSSYATEENLAQAIASTYTDNLFLDTLTIKVGDKTYGPLEYKKAE